MIFQPFLFRSFLGSGLQTSGQTVQQPVRMHGQCFLPCIEILLSQEGVQLLHIGGWSLGRALSIRGGIGEGHLVGRLAQSIIQVKDLFSHPKCAIRGHIMISRDLFTLHITQKARILRDLREGFILETHDIQRSYVGDAGSCQVRDLHLIRRRRQDPDPALQKAGIQDLTVGFQVNGLRS